MSGGILLVDDDPGAIQLMARILAGLGTLRFATSGEQALALAAEFAPDLILLDADMPGMSGFQVCEALKADPAFVEVPVVFVTGQHAAEFEIAGFEAGAADFIAKPFRPALVVARVKAQLRVKRMSDELRRLSTIDALTGVANRRQLDEALRREWLRRRRTGEPLALMLVDVDHFKLFNDHYGHPAGDACLRAIAQVMVETSRRPGDLVARYGGEEFALLLPRTPRADAEHLAARLLGGFETLAVPHAVSPTATHVTVSVGTAVLDEGAARSTGTRGRDGDAATVQALLEAADKALYAAKAAGRARMHLLDLPDVAPSLAGAVARHAPVAA